MTQQRDKNEIVRAHLDRLRDDKIDKGMKKDLALSRFRKSEFPRDQEYDDAKEAIMEFELATAAYYTVLTLAHDLGVYEDE